MGCEKDRAGNGKRTAWGGGEGQGGKRDKDRAGRGIRTGRGG